jgi:hypothetical protein
VTPRYSVRVKEIPRGEGYFAEVWRGRYVVGQCVATSAGESLRGAVRHVRRRRKDGAFPLFDSAGSIHYSAT